MASLKVPETVLEHALRLLETILVHLAHAGRWVDVAEGLPVHDLDRVAIPGPTDHVILAWVVGRVVQVSDKALRTHREKRGGWGYWQQALLPHRGVRTPTPWRTAHAPSAPDDIAGRSDPLLTLLSTFPLPSSRVSGALIKAHAHKKHCTWWHTHVVARAHAHD